MKSITKIILSSLLLIFAGGIGGAFFGDYFRSALRNCNLFSQCSLLQGGEENVTVINNTEKVIVEEDHNINEISAGARLAVVNILSLESSEKKIKNNFNKIEAKIGTGTILTNDGLIVTDSKNIIEKNANYEVTIFDGTVLNANLVAIDNFTGLAYLRVKGINLPAIPFANVEDMNIGKKIISIGKKNATQNISLAEGTISSFDRNFNLLDNAVFSSEKTTNVLLLNIGINAKRTFSGGPVINYSGELVAIGLVSKEKYYQIPISAVKNAMDMIANNNLLLRAEFGAYYIPINKLTAKLHGLSVDYGALIYSTEGKQGLAVIKNSVADKSGVRLNDIILEIGNKKIDQENSLASVIATFKQGDNVKIKILRAGKEIELPAKF